MVGALLSLLALAVLQLGFALHVRNIVQDAAAAGAHSAALVDGTPADAEAAVRTRIATALGEGHADDVVISLTPDAAIVTVHTTLPLVGLLGPAEAWEVTARAPRESLDVP